MYHVNEIRNFDEIAKGEAARISDAENKLAVGLIEQLTAEEFKPDDYRDEYRGPILGFLDEKGKGPEAIHCFRSPS